MTYAIRLLIFLLLFPLSVQGQHPLGQHPLAGKFLTDSIDIGRPFQYSLVYRHAAVNDVLFPDTARNFAPYRVQNVTVFATQTSGAGSGAVSRDSAVYTLVSFETDSIQRLQVPVRIIHQADCTAQWTQTDTVFLRSKLPVVTVADSTRSVTLPALLTETKLAPLQQQFNYVALAAGFLLVTLVMLVLYGLLGQIITRYWQLYQLSRSHRRFLNEYNQLTRSLNAFSASETARRAVMIWKVYLERLDGQPYTSLTTSELAERIHDDRILNALREADRMIYGGTFSPESLPALQLLTEVATNIYQRYRSRMQNRTSLVDTTLRPLAEKNARTLN